ncbi:MAG: tyrosine-type recombinase/integrase [Raoultibacter sp.]
MAVRKLKNGKWIADVVVGLKWDGTKDRRSECFKTQAMAKKAEQRLLLEKERQRGRVSACITLADFLEEVYWPQKTKMRMNTRRGYERDIKLRLLPAFGNMDIDQINRLAIQRMISTCPTRKVATNARETLSSILGVAVEMEMIAVNPAGYRYQFPEKSELAEDHYGEWLTTFDAHWPLLEFVAANYSGEAEERIVVLGMCFGLRKGEVFGLDWSTVSLALREIRIEQSYTVAKGGAYLTAPKTTRAIRTLPMSDYAYERIKSWGSGDGAVVMGHDGNRMHPNTGSNRIRKLVNQVYTEGSPLPHITIYSLRHSFATACINEGMDISKVSAMLGHKDTSTTQNIYVKPKLCDLKKDTCIINDAYRRAGINSAN